MSLDGTIDPRANCVRVCDEEHEVIHDAKVWGTTETTTILAGATYNYSVVTSTASPHLVFRVDSDQATTVVFNEASTSVSGGSAMTAINRNRYGSSAITAVTKGVTVGGAGTQLWTRAVRTAAAPTAPILIGGNLRPEMEWILKSSTTYTLQITNNGAATANVATEISWYEL